MENINNIKKVSNNKDNIYNNIEKYLYNTGDIPQINAIINAK